jgi:serine/threonine-protein kinase
MLQCPNCHTINKPAARFCNSCGAPLGVGQTIALGGVVQGRYTVIRLLGQGGMGAVYQVADSRIGGKLLAMKEMSDAALTDPQEKAAAIAAFGQEAQLLARLDHPNIPKISDFFTENQKHYIVMEFVPGETLENRLARQAAPCGEADVRNWALQLSDVLEYLHRQVPPVIFRDLKPGNIMVTPQGQLKLIDFGIARLFKPGKAGDTHVMGTPGFAPPEQYGKGQTDARSDIYSLGVVLHHLLTCYDPASTPFRLPPVRQISRNVSQELEVIVARASHPAVAQRYQSVAELRRDLYGSAPASPMAPAVTPSPAATPAPARRSVPAWVVVVVAIAMLGAGVVIADRMSGSSPPTPIVIEKIVVVPPTTAAPAAAPTTPRPVLSSPTATQRPTAVPIAPSLIPTRSPTLRPVTPTYTPGPDWAAYEQAVRNQIIRYGDTKPEFFTNLSSGRLTDFMVDPVLESQKRAICWLRNERLYYTYADRRLDITDVRFEGDSHATVLVQIVETRVLRKQDGGVRMDYGRESYRAIYQLRRLGNRWYIYCLQALEEGDPIQCEIKFEGPNPCQP